MFRMLKLNELEAVVVLTALALIGIAVAGAIFGV